MSTSLKSSRSDAQRSDPTCGSLQSGLRVLRPSLKIHDSHLDRLAVVYIRQSSPQQVHENRESRERQYGLAEFAQHLGWSAERVLVIDEDQGISGRRASNRSGFQRLIGEVSMNHVGIVLALELNRLSRSNKDWHHLVEVCAVFNTLLGDQDGLYDASDSNDRLLLGMKGAMSEFELITLRNRLQRGRENKANRGDLFLHMPIGYVKLPSGEIAQEPDELARGIVHLIFEKFQELGTVWAVFRYLVENGIQLGFRSLRGPNRGQLEWRRPHAQRILFILRHPIYGGAYAYGLHRPGQRNPVTGQVEGGKWILAPGETKVLIRDRVPAYISWDQFLANQQRITENRTLPTTKGATRRGEALLSGLIFCGCCGRRMSVAYQVKKKPHYWCDGHLHERRSQRCPGMKATALDDLVVQQVLRALKPAAVDLSLRAAEHVEDERQRLHRVWQQRLERARYDCERAERQYHSVEPENRLVARTLESRWEQALSEQRELQEEYDRFLAATPAGLSESERMRIRAMAEDIRALWHATGTTIADRKAIVRCLIDHVVLHIKPQSEYVDATIEWNGGFVSQHELARPVVGYAQLRDHDRLIARIKQLHQAGTTVPVIAERLNEEGFVPPRRRGKFSVECLAPLLKQLGLVGELRREDVLGPDEWWIRVLASALQTPVPKVYYWVAQGWVHSRNTPSGRHRIVWADKDELNRLRELSAERNSYTAVRKPELVIPKRREAE